MDGLKLLLKAHDEFQERVQRGDVLGASKMLIALRKALPDDIPAELKAGFYLDEVQVLVLQNDLPAARGAVSKALAVSPDEHTRGAALVQLATIDMREEPGPETKQQLQEGLKIALKYDDHGLAGDAASNIATLLAIEGNTDEAKRYWLTAKSHYEHSGRESQVLVCEHFLATAAVLEGKETEADLATMENTLDRAYKRKDAAAVTLVGGDLARTLFCRHHEGHPTDLSKAQALMSLVESADDFMWAQGTKADESVGARIERAEGAFNNIETAIAICLDRQDPVGAFAACCTAKARILRDSLGPRTSGQIEKFRSIDPRFASLDSKHLAIDAFPQLVNELASGYGSLATIDQFLLSGDSFYAHVDVCEEREPWTQSVVAHWPGQPESPLFARQMRGKGQGVQARRLQGDLLQEFERQSGRAPFLFSRETAEADSGQKGRMLEDAESIRDKLRALGVWLFPKDLRDALLKSEVRHLFLSPDPRLFSLPWQALLFEDGTALVDQPWTLSLLPSALSLYDVARRRTRKVHENIALFGPDGSVNGDAGGSLELEMIRAFRPTASVVTEEQATLAAMANSVENSGWVHLRTHGVHSHGVYVPKLHDGPWNEPIQNGVSSYPVLVSTSCRTGETLSKGQDVFGMVEIAERSDFRSVVTPIVSVDGFAAYHWMRDFYAKLAGGVNIAQAVRAASCSMRERLPHPAFWAAFICTGDPTCVLPG